MILLCLVAAVSVQPAGSADQAEFLRLSFKANKDAFAFGTFHFEYTRGVCASLSDAEAGVFSKSIREDGLYVVDGKNERYDLLADATALAAVTTHVAKNKTSSFARVFRMLTNGQVTLLDRLWLDDSSKFSHRSPEIYPGTSIFCGSAYFQFPLSLGNCDKFTTDLFDDLSACKDGKCTITELDFDAQLDGLPVCKLSYTFRTGKCTHWIDRNRGCLSVRVVIHDNASGSDSIYRFGEFEHVKGAGWLPRRRLHIWAKGQLADRIVVTGIDTTRRPDRSMFQLDFAEPVPLPDGTKGVIHSKRKNWSLLDLPIAMAPGAHLLTHDRTSFGQMPGEIEGHFNWTAVVAATTGVLLVVLTVILWRRSRRRPRA
jgi:hypothetical protein